MLQAFLQQPAPSWAQTQEILVWPLDTFSLKGNGFPGSAVQCTTEDRGQTRGDSVGQAVFGFQ